MIGKYKNNTILKWIYVLSMIIAFSTRLGDIQIGYKPAIYLSLFWLFLGAINILANAKKTRKSNVMVFLKANLYPCIIIHVYSVLLMLVGAMDSSYMSSNVTVYVPVALAIICVYLFGVNVIYYIFFSLICSWIISVTVSFCSHGFGIFVVAIRKALDSSYISNTGYKYNYLEMNDLVLAIGYVLIYYMITQDKINRKNFLIICMTVLIMFLGLKRIAALGMIGVVIFNYVLKIFDERKKMLVCKIACHVILIASVCFILVLFNGDVFYALVDRFGINTAGRVYYYKAATNLAEFSPSFLGIGRNALSEMLNYGDLTYLNVGGLHSDILKMYVENGFVMFFFWLYVNIYYIPNKYKRRFGTNEYTLCVAFLIYTFILFLTDNTENYFICQLLRICIPFAYAMKNQQYLRYDS